MKEGLGLPTSAFMKYNEIFDYGGTKDFKETKVIRKKQKTTYESKMITQLHHIVHLQSLSTLLFLPKLSFCASPCFDR